MRKSLGLSLYLLATSNRPQPGGTGDGSGALRPPRPKGPLVWLHVPLTASWRAAAELARRLVSARPELTVLMTAPSDGGLPDGAIWQPPPPDTLPDAAAFLTHWHPMLAVQIAGPLSPATLRQIHAAGVPYFLIEGQPPADWPIRAVPGVARALLQPAARIMARDDEAQRSFRRFGAPLDRLETGGKLEEGSRALPCTEAERAALAKVLSTRPVWLAAGLPMSEIDAVIAAHRAALRLAHRLLLIVAPQDPAQAQAMAEKMAGGQNWTVARRSADEYPDEEVQAYIADTEDEFGLWYRLAPITFLGGSLADSGSVRHPFEPASLGSAVIHGPRTGQMASSFAQLAEAQAVREIRAAPDLGEAVSDLLAPDRAAVLAHNAWAAISSGAETTERVTRLLLDALDAAGRA